MDPTRNIVIGDESALFAMLHADSGQQVAQRALVTSPLDASAETASELQAFNTGHPLYGGRPVHLLVSEAANKRHTKDVTCRLAPNGLPERSFFFIRKGLYMTTPELTFLRMAAFKSEMQLARIATDLCGRYYIDVATGSIEDRTAFLTTPEALRAYCSHLPRVRGSKKALDALRWVFPNSGSPRETQCQLLLSLPLGRGGFALPFTHMNYDVRSGRLAHITEQDEYSIDFANPDLKIGAEYDGRDSHPDPSADKRRRNELKALGWDIFPFEKDVLEDPDRMARFAAGMAAVMHVKRQHSRAWAAKYLKLRRELGLRE